LACLVTRSASKAAVSGIANGILAEVDRP
jgi:hypothetical protein